MQHRTNIYIYACIWNKNYYLSVIRENGDGIVIFFSPLP